MEWEDRFSSIMKETAANLARVQARLHSSSSQPDRTYTRANTRHSTLQGRSSLGPTRNPSVGGQSLWQSCQTLIPRANHESVIITSFTSNDQCSDRKNQDQAEILTSVSKQVQQLQREKDSQTEIIYRLQDEVAILHERIKEQGIDLPTENKMQQFKQELRNEMEDLQSQIRVSKHQDSRDRFTDTSLSALARDLKDSKRMDQDERDSLRRELDNLRSRLVKSELDLQSVLAETKDLVRKQDKVEKAVTTVSETQHSQSRSLNQVVEDKQLDAFQFSEIRNALAELRNSINDVETEILQLQTTGDFSNLAPRSRRNKLDTRASREPRNGRASRSRLSTKPSASERTSNSHKSVVSSDSDLDMSIATAELDISDSDISISTTTHNNGTLTGTTADITAGDVGDSSASVSSLDSDDLLSELP